jgi:hypothetical protein
MRRALLVGVLGALIGWVLLRVWMKSVETRPMNGQRVTVNGIEYEFTSDAMKVDDWWMVQLKEVNR